MRVQFLAAALCCLMLGADEPKEDAVKQEMTKFQGTWTVVSQTGERDLPPGLKIQKVIIKGTEMTFVKQRFNTVEEFTVDPSKSPKEMDQIFVEGPSKGNVLMGICELDGDNLKLCYNINSKIKDRPSEFKDNLSWVRLVILKREKP